MKRIYVLSIFLVGMVHAMQMVPLRDGSVRPLPAVEKTKLKLKQLLERNQLPGVLAIYQLQQKAQNPDFHLWDSMQFFLEQYDLVDSKGRMSDIVRSVVLSSVKFNHETSQVWIHDPVATER